jgi:tetratricopeptide (TPR) repeat protein
LILIRDIIRSFLSFAKDSLVELGIILLSLKEYSDSLEVLTEALELRENEAEDLVFPKEIKESQLKIAKILNNIGCVHFESGNFESAKEAFMDAITLQKESLGEFVVSSSVDDPTSRPGYLTMASTMCNKGYTDIVDDNYRAAILIFNESLQIQRQLLGADNKLVLSTLDNLGFAYSMTGRYNKAITVSILFLVFFQKFSNLKLDNQYIPKPYKR